MSEDNKTDPSEELKPCPFCGGEAVYDNNGAGIEAIDCVDCGAKVEGLIGTMGDNVYELWNKRVKDD